LWTNASDCAGVLRKLQTADAKVEVAQTMVDADVIKGAVELAVRAPSLHNSQPWRWVADGEFHASREIVRRLTGRHAEPQLLIRVGTIPQTESPPSPPPRRPVSEILEIRR
jgi:nitroreductase